MSEIPRTKKCNRCNIEKPVSEYYKQKGGKDGLRPECKQCVSAYYKEEYENNPSVKYRKIQANKKRAKCIKIFCPKVDKKFVVEIICDVCGKKFGVEKNRLQQNGYTRKYCSRDCFSISRRKTWREKSPYAKKIKNLLKNKFAESPLPATGDR